METTIKNQTILKSRIISKSNIWIGRILSAIVVLFMLFDGIIHLLKNAPVVEAFNKLGFPLELSTAIGILEIACVVLYIIPDTSIFGAIVLTGYLGGATAIQLRIGEPLFSHALFPVYVGVFIWGGVYLRDSYLRSLIPFRKREEN